MNFDEKRENLLKECYEVREADDLKGDFERKFFNLIEDIILFLIQSDDSFFGQFLLKVKRNIRIDIKYPIGTIPKIDGFNMYFNPYLFLQCTKREMAALLKHEIYHIMNSHYERAKVMQNRFCKEAINTALDISVNQYIKNLPGFSKKLYDISKEYNIELQENRTVEEYAEKINASIKSRTKEKNIDKENKLEEVDTDKAHELWEEIDISQEDIKKLTQKTAISIYDKNTPESLLKIILSYNEKPEIPWNIVLKNMIPTIKSGYKKTITRRDRRQPDRLDIRGRLPKDSVNLIIALDISASMTDDDIKKILFEVLAISKASNNKITIIECDSEIRSVYQIKSIKDIRKRSKDNGFTAFSPVFKYISENNLRNSILIYFTDGVGEKELSIKPINKKTLWVIIGNEKLSLNESFGEIKRINAKNKEIIEGNLGLQMLNEAIHDWAR